MISIRVEWFFLLFVLLNKIKEYEILIIRGNEIIN